MASLLTIAEVAERTGLTAHTLRYSIATLQHATHALQAKICRTDT
ncbi:MAG TPA: hypothetical protein PKA20_21045 [Burkholderiaceae bacterium]|nr:hypothetical protein [Burkholderiaceae bacterium]